MIGSIPILSYDRSKSNSIGSGNFFDEYFFYECTSSLNLQINTQIYKTRFYIKINANSQITFKIIK